MQRKVFRIEQTAARPRASAMARHDLPRAKSVETNHLEREIAALHDTIEKSRRELAALTVERESHASLARAASELAAAIAGMEKATQQILKVTEVIDESARALGATLKDDYKRGLALEIQENVARIFEACNFQDISGQRISKAMTTLKFADESIERVLDISGGMEHHRRGHLPTGNKLLHGPQLEGDTGHTSQHEIDRLFR